MRKALTILVLLAIVFPAAGFAQDKCAPCAPDLTYVFRDLGSEHATMDAVYAGCRPEMEYWAVHAEYRPAKGRDRAGLYVVKSVLRAINPSEAVRIKNQITFTCNKNSEKINGKNVTLFWPAELKNMDGAILSE
jgi:hypothetical protein